MLDRTQHVDGNVCPGCFAEHLRDLADKVERENIIALCVVAISDEGDETMALVDHSVDVEMVDQMVHSAKVSLFEAISDE